MKHILVTICLILLLCVDVQAQQGWSVQTNPLGPQGPPTPALGKIQFVSLTEGWITADNGELLHTTNGGTQWVAVSPGGNDTVSFVNNPAVGLSFVSATTGWAVGTLHGSDSAGQAVLYNTTNGGGTWSRQLLNTWNFGFGVQFVDANNGWVSVFRGTSPTNTLGALIHTTDGGTSWTMQYNADWKLPIVSFIDSNNGWALTDSLSHSGLSSPCEILRTTNAGVTWTAQFRDTTPGWLEAFQMVDATHGWVVGDSAKILRTVDGGTHWTPVTNTGNNSDHSAVFFLNDSLGWIGGRPSSNQGVPIVLHTTNGGGSWSIQNTSTQTEGIFSIYFIDADNGWYTADYGGIAHATNAGDPTSVLRTSNSTAPARFELVQNYPNPFNPTTTIEFAIPIDGRVVLKVYDLLGREVAALLDGYRRAGEHQQVTFDASRLASGIYFYRLQTGHLAITRRLVLLK
ncbi:MAG TPA: YCF48-related protein [Bacteroidota bacterium]